MKKYVFIFLLPFALMAGSPFTVGTTSGYAPYVSLNVKGEYEGFDIDIANLVAKKLGKELAIKDCGSMPSLMLALKDNKVDALIWAISITEERQKGMEMIYYQGELVEEMPLLFWKKAPESVQNFGDLKNTVSVEAGSYQESVLGKYPNVKLKYLSSVNDAIMDIKYGKSEATCIDPSLVSRIQKQFPEIQVKQIPLPVDARSLGNGICINKSKPDLAKKVKKAVSELQQEGKIQELEKKWGLSQ